MESAIAIVDANGQVKGEWIHSQIAKHAEYGVVPDLAVGEHLRNFFPLLDLARTELSIPTGLESVAVTCGPGLAGCLGVDNHSQNAFFTVGYSSQWSESSERACILSVYASGKCS